MSKTYFWFFFHENYDYTSETDFRIPPHKKRIHSLMDTIYQKVFTYANLHINVCCAGVQVKELGVPLDTQIRGRWPRNPYSPIMGSPLLFSFVALIRGEGKRKGRNDLLVKLSGVWGRIYLSGTGFDEFQGQSINILPHISINTYINIYTFTVYI